MSNLYHYRGSPGRDVSGQRTWAYPPGTVRLVGIALDRRTKQERVVYEETEGPHAGKMLLCGLAEWARDFQTIWDKGKNLSEPTEEVPDVPAARQAGTITTGSGA